MKRLWIGIALLLIMLISGIFAAWGIPALHNRLSHTLQQACDTVQQEDWETANALVDQAKSQWERSRHLIASLVDHEPLEQMDTLFAELEIYAKCRLTADYAAVCAHLSHLSEAIGESQSLRWWNLL